MTTTMQPPEPEDIQRTLGVGGPQHRRYLRWLALLLPLLLLLAWWLWWSGNGDDSSLPYKTSEVKHGDLAITVTATGTLQPLTQVEVGSEISGTIKSVAVDYNDRVKKGQVLAQLDTEQLLARVAQSEATLHLARAGVKEAQATLKENKAKLQRNQELYKSGLGSLEESEASEAAYTRAQAALERATAQVVEAKASLDANRTSLQKATIRSPIDGIVLKRGVEPGQTVAASFQTPVLFLLAENLTQMALHVDIDEADVGQVEQGQAASFTVDAYPERHFPATITEVHYAPQTVEGVVTYETLLAVDNADLSLRPGMTATAEITVRRLEDVVLIPNAALRYRPEAAKAKKGSSSVMDAIMPRRHRPSREREGTEGQQVWALVDGQAVAIPVRIGASDGNYSQLLEGEVEPGMRLITERRDNGK